MTTPEMPLTPQEHRQTFEALKLATTLGEEIKPETSERDVHDKKAPLVASASQLMLDVVETGSVRETFSDFYPKELLTDVIVDYTHYTKEDHPDTASLVAISSAPNGLDWTRAFELTNTENPNPLTDATVNTYVMGPGGESLRFLTKSGDFSIGDSQPMTDREARLARTVVALALLKAGLDNPENF